MILSHVRPELTAKQSEGQTTDTPTPILYPYNHATVFNELHEMLNTCVGGYGPSVPRMAKLWFSAG